jgi:hypothetical protein
MYPTESMAEEALISAWITYQYTHGNGPIGVYRCQDCGSYHLTSKGTINSKLQKALSSGIIQKSKEINTWLDKIKRKR